jgi:hypothetical protein
MRFHHVALILITLTTSCAVWDAIKGPATAALEAGLVAYNQQQLSHAQELAPGLASDSDDVKRLAGRVAAVELALEQVKAASCVEDFDAATKASELANQRLFAELKALPAAAHVPFTRPADAGAD